MLVMTEILTEPVKEIESIHLKTLVCKLNLQKWINVSNLRHMYNKGISTIFHMYQKCLRDIQSHYLQLLLQNVWYGIFITDCLVLTDIFFILWYYLMILSTRILSILEAVEWIQSMFLIKETVVSLSYMDDTQLFCRSVNIVNVRLVK